MPEQQPQEKKEMKIALKDKSTSPERYAILNRVYAAYLFSYKGERQMKAKEVGTVFFLQDEKIDYASELIVGYLKELGLERKEIERLRLSAENILISLQERFGKTASVRLSCYSRLGQPIIRLASEGDPFDPMNVDEEAGEWSRTLLARLKTQPIYNYSRGTNIVTFKVMQRRKNPFLLLLVALAAAVLVGLAGGLLPNDFRTAAAEEWLGPICDTYLNVLGFCCIPLIFLAVALGIIGVGDINAFEKIGRKMVRHNIRTLLITTALAAAAAYPFFRFTFGESSLQVAYTDLLKMVLGWLPTNLIQPFLDCNAIQLIIMGTVFGIGLLKLDPLAKNLANVLDDLNNFLLLVSEWLTRLIPVFVFIMIVRSIWTGQISEVLPVWKSWVVTTGLEASALLIMALTVCRKYKVRLGLLLKKVSQTFLIALGTNSCSASISENYACCAGKLGLDSRVFGFGIPIGTSTFKPGAAIRMVVLCYYMATAYHVTVTPAWFVLTVLLAAIMSIAVPAIPGGVLMFCPMLFAQLGLPANAVAPMLATDIFFDAICTAFNQVFVQIALVKQGGQMGLLNTDVLRR